MTETPLLDCDIVMAGGVTSGIVYPAAVAVIARRYRFHSIGGTSVGALAAAVTAACEFGRTSGMNPNSFKELGNLSTTLSEAAPRGGTRLLRLFFPDAKTRDFWDALSGAFKGNGKSAVLAGFAWALLREPYVTATFIVCSLVSILFLYILGVTAFSHAWLIVPAIWSGLAGAIFVVAATLAAGAWRVWTDWLPTWVENGYGLSTGNAHGAEQSFPTLTPWLHELIQKSAGLEPKGDPLTFGQLWSGKVEASVDPYTSRAIDLAMIVSDISRNRNAQLPFIEFPSPLYVKLSDLERYFPPEVVKWVVEHQGKSEREVVFADKEDDAVSPKPMPIRLPQPSQLPVVLAARMSLSFPVLLCAVPLYTPDFAAGGSPLRLRKVWFSDGGLTSNFPIHFFDSPIPSRPTFGLNLVGADHDMPEEEQVAAGNDVSRAGSSGRKSTAKIAVAENDPQPDDPVWNYVTMAKGEEMAPAPFSTFDNNGQKNILAFGNALLSTARGVSDNQMMLAPGVRDRIVNIALREQEGGINLNMDRDTIAALDFRGRAAGLLLSARFDPARKDAPNTKGVANVNEFPNHRWVRYRNFMASLEDAVRRLAVSRDRSDTAAAARGESDLAKMMAGEATEKLSYYKLTSEARAYYRDTTDRLAHVGHEIGKKAKDDPTQSFDEKPDEPFGRARGAGPRPPMRAAVRPLTAQDPRYEYPDFP